MKELNYIKRIMTTAGKMINYNNIKTQTKNMVDLVTNKDIEVEKYLISKIKKKFPNDKFITEETNSEVKLTDGRFWIIDPIDGTSNFANKIPFYAIQIALVKDKKTIFSAIYHPVTKDFYYAIKGQGAFLNSKPIRTKNNVNLNQAISTFPDYTKVTKVHKQNQLKLIKILYANISKLKFIGSAAVDFSLLARGSTDFHFIDKGGLWDYIPGYFLAQEAGAHFEEINLSQNDKTTLLISCSNKQLLKELLKVLD